MKRILWIGVCICLLLSMAACGQSPIDPASGTEPSEVSTPTETTVPVVQHEPQGLEAFAGCYSMAEDYFVQIRSFDGFMILEHIVYTDEEVYDTWTQEFWPDAGAVPADPYTGMSGKIQNAVPTQHGVAFEDMPQTCTIAATDTGICLRMDGEQVEMTSTDEFSCIHTPWQDLLQKLYDRMPCSPGEGPAGGWYSWDGVCFIYARLDEDGRFFWLNKPMHEPAQIYEGGWSVTEDNCVTVLAEMLGTGQFPQEIRISWEYDSEGFLYLEDAQSPLMYGNGGYACLYPYDPQMEIAFRQMDGLCYVKECWGISDSYTDDQGNDVYYNYNLPAFLGESDAINDLNAQIQTTFGTVIEDGYAALQRGEMPYCNAVYWEYYDMAEVIAVIINADTLEGTQCVAYYYDTATDTQIYSADVLSLLDLDEAAYLDGLYCAMQDTAPLYFDDPDSAEAQACISWMLSEDNLNLGRPFAIDEFGEMFTYVQFETPNGTWWGMLYPFRESEVVD